MRDIIFHMRSHLRPLLAIAICAAALAHAQDYPNRPIKLVLPQAPGSGSDVVARMLADSMSRELGQPVVVDNRPGANGLIAQQMVAKEPPDGYTLLQTSVSLVSFNKYMYKNVGSDPIKDFTFISPVADASFVVVASKASGIKSWDELVRTGRANPDKLTFGSAGAGNSTHLYTEMIARRAGFKARHIPYKGSAPALMSIVAGETDFMVVPTVVAFTQVEAGKITALAQSGDVKSSHLPNVPLLKEVAPDVPPLPGWYAIVGPAKMDPKIVQKLSAAINRFLGDPAVKAKLTDQFLNPIPGTPEGIQKRGEQESQLWGALIRDLKIAAD
jgi:tripartite-type tricarboxylate transporter receptor subunit TctC